MRYVMPNFPCDFEIPDDWIAESGIGAFRPGEPSYRPASDARVVSLSEIVPPSRGRDCHNDWHGFDRKRLVDVLRGITTRDKIAPVPVIELPKSDHLLRLSHQYFVRDGFHRYYGSIMAGFSYLPVSVITLGGMLEQSRNLGLR